MTNKKPSISLIDMEIMTNIFGSNQVVIREYLKNFIKVTFELLEKTEDAIHKKNRQLALDYLHKLKSPVGTIGFKKMYQLCEKTEEKINQEDWSTATAIYNDIEKILRKLQIEVEKEF